MCAKGNGLCGPERIGPTCEISTQYVAHLREWTQTGVRSRAHHQLSLSKPTSCDGEYLLLSDRRPRLVILYHSLYAPVRSVAPIILESRAKKKQRPLHCHHIKNPSVEKQNWSHYLIMPGDVSLAGLQRHGPKSITSKQGSSSYAQTEPRRRSTCCRSSLRCEEKP